MLSENLPPCPCKTDDPSWGGGGIHFAKAADAAARGYSTPRKVLPKSGPHVVAQCIQCSKKKKIYAGEVAADDVPMCDDCFMPMVAVKASSR